MPPQSRRSRPSPPGFACGSPPCTKSFKINIPEEPWAALRAQNQLDETKVCRWAENCAHNQDGNCFFYHPPEHQHARPAMARRGLEFLESVDLENLVGEREVCTEDEGDLASFNKIGDDEIAVPGM
jgi:hypothetical protein